MKKRILILGMILTYNANAASDCGDDLDNNCWDCGKTASDLCTARLNGTTLSITGSGQMKDYEFFVGDTSIGEAYYRNNAPWGNTGKGNTEITNITVDGITRVGESAFLGATNLQNITFSDSVVEIGQNALHSSGLTHLELPEHLQTLEGGSIQYLQSVSSITIPESVETIGNAVFNNWDSLENIVIPDSVKTLGARVFSACDNLKSIVIGDGVTSILENSFNGTSAYIYCQDTAERSCKDLIGQNNSNALNKLKIYTIENGKIKVGSKIYNSLDDLPKYTLKRIYTLEEANEAAGSVNRVSIKYR